MVGKSVFFIIYRELFIDFFVLYGKIYMRGNYDRYALSSNNGVG